MCIGIIYVMDFCIEREGTNLPQTFLVPPKSDFDLVEHGSTSVFVGEFSV